jgi:hypothetical protein
MAITPTVNAEGCAYAPGRCHVGRRRISMLDDNKSLAEDRMPFEGLQVILRFCRRFHANLRAEGVRVLLAACASLLVFSFAPPADAGESRIKLLLYRQCLKQKKAGLALDPKCSTVGHFRFSKTVLAEKRWLSGRAKGGPSDQEGPAGRARGDFPDQGRLSGRARGPSALRERRPGRAEHQGSSQQAMHGVQRDQGGGSATSTEKRPKSYSRSPSVTT